MTILVRLLTLLTIAAAGFAMPMTCAQSGGASAAEPVAIEIPAPHRLDPVPVDEATTAARQQVEHNLVDRLLHKLPFDCGETTPQVTDHPATFDTQPSVPGYLVSTILLDEERSDIFAPPPALIPIDSRAGPPDAPPPKSID